MSAMTFDEQLAARARAQASGLWSPDQERDGCGVGLIVSLDGAHRREIVELAVKSLKAVWHRGAVDADGRTGDGAGVLLQIPDAFFRQECASLEFDLPAPGQYGMGMIFFSPNE